MVVQQAGKCVLFLEDEIAAKKYRARKFLGDRCAKRFELLDQIDTQAGTRFGVPPQTVCVLDETFEIFLGLAFQAVDLAVSFELAGIDHTDGNKNDVFEIIWKQPLDVQQGMNG